MATPFSHSMRAVHQDSSYANLVGLSIAILLIILWLLWFFLAPITLYTTGTIVQVTRSDSIIATFPQQAVDQIHPNQHARVWPQLVTSTEASADTQEQSDQSISATVLEILGSTDNNQILVELHGRWNRATANFISDSETRDAVVGTVEIEVETVSPATLVSRASGQLVDTPTLSFSPQGR